LYGTPRGGDRFFCELLVRIFDLRKGFGVKILQQRIVGMKLALLSEEGTLSRRPARARRFLDHRLR
jgi:hypothetical protein